MKKILLVLSLVSCLKASEKINSIDDWFVENTSWLILENNKKKYGKELSQFLKLKEILYSGSVTGLVEAFEGDDSNKENYSSVVEVIRLSVINTQEEEYFKKLKIKFPKLKVVSDVQIQNKPKITEKYGLTLMSDHEGIFKPTNFPIINTDLWGESKDAFMCARAIELAKTKE